jgi:tetratricopeptide (TPR) repeat protein
MRRKLNVRWLVGLVAVGLLATVTLNWWYGVQDRRRRQTLIEQADRAEAAGRPDLAASYLWRYLRLQPNDLDAQARYALLFDRTAATPEDRALVLQLLGKVLASRPFRDDIGKRYARLALELGQVSVAQGQCQLLLQSRPEDGAVEHLLGRCAAATGNLHEAAAWYGKAARHAPQMIDAHLDLADVLQHQLNEPEPAREALDAAAEANPSSTRVLLARARLLHRVGELDLAEADLARARALAPAEYDVLLVSGELLLTRGRLDAARAALQECLRLQPARGSLYLILAAVEQRAGRPAEALACLRQGMRAVPPAEHDTLGLQVAELLAQQARPAEARAEVEALRRGDTPPARLDLLEARLLIQEGRWAEAAVTLARAHPELTGAEAALATQLAQVAGEPADHRHHLWLGRNLWSASGPSPEVESTFRRAFDRGGHTPEAAAALVQYLLQAGRKDDAAAVVARVRADWPPAQALAVVPYCLELLGRPDEADREYAGALALAEPPAAVLRSAAEFYLRYNAFPRAEPHLRRLLDVKAPTTDQTWARRKLAVGLALGGDHGGFQEALALLRQNPSWLTEEAVENQRARAIVLAQAAHGRAEAVRLLEALNERGALTLAERFLLAQLHDAGGDWPRARQHVLALLAAPHGKAPETLAFAVRGLVRHGAVKEAAPLLAELKRLEPGALRTAFLEACALKAGGGGAAAALLQACADRPGADPVAVAAALEELGEADAADALLERHAESGRQPDVLLARAQFLGRHKRLGEALAVCDRAWAQFPGEQVAEVYVSLVRTGAATDAHIGFVEERLRDAQARTHCSVPLWLARADVHVLRGRNDEAVELYRVVLAKQPNNLVAINNLAWLLGWRKEQAQEALDLVNRGIELRGPVAALLDTRASAFLALGNSRAALQDLDQAIAQEPTAARYVHQARAHWLGGQADEAKAALGHARAAHLDPAALHPLDRTAYEVLLKNLGEK